ALEEVVDRGNAAVGVAGRAAEAEERRGKAAIDRESGAGNRARPERVAVRALEGRLQADTIALQLLDDGKEVVRDGARLSGLRVRGQGEDGVEVRLGEIQQRTAQGERAGEQRQYQLPLPHPVHRHVDVVARACRMQAAGDVIAACLDDQAFDVKEQVLVGAVV